MAVLDRIRLTGGLAPLPRQLGFDADLELLTTVSKRMCGRFSITGELDFYAEYFGVDEVVTERIEPSWNVAPTDPVYTITEKEGRRLLGSMQWGLVPHWATDTKTIHINARAETVATTAAFRDSFARRRCLIPADGFYEWEPPEQGRTPHWVYRADGHPLVFAGIWASRRDPDSGDWLRTCSIVTTGSTGPIAPIHDRMPVALDPRVWGAWIDRGVTDPGRVLDSLQVIDSEALMEHVVSRQVNSVRNDDPSLREPAKPETLF